MSFHHAAPQSALAAAYKNVAEAEALTSAILRVLMCMTIELSWGCCSIGTQPDMLAYPHIFSTHSHLGQFSVAKLLTNMWLGGGTKAENPEELHR